MRVVFMGTPMFAAENLQKLIDEKYEIAGVFTHPDKPRGRGMKVSATPVKELALSCEIPIFQPDNMRDGKVLDVLKAWAPDVIVVVAYGRILPEDIISAAPLGCINVHASILPKYRGAAPIQWAVLNGDETTGVTTMYIAPELDAGDIIYTSETKIGEYETSGELFERLTVLGAELLHKTLCDIKSGTAPRTPQNPDHATFTKQLDKSMSPIDWNRSARAVVRQIYGLLPWPVATTSLAGYDMRVFEARYSETKTDKKPGTIISAGKDGIEVACANGEAVYITCLQLPNKKTMTASAFLLGHPIKVEA